MHSATNDIEIMDSEYKEEQENEVSDHDNTGAKGKNTEYVLLMLWWVGEWVSERHIILIQTVFAPTP